MAAATRLFGSAASGAANLLLYGTLFALWPALAECTYGRCIDGDGPTSISVDTWRPFIDNPGRIDAAVEWEPQCPAPAAMGDPHLLYAAPLPDGYDPHADRRSPSYVCVLVGRSGEVLGVRILRGTGRGSLDRSLVRTVRRSWRFGPAGWEARTPSWQRVRIDSGSVNGAIWDLPLML